MRLWIRISAFISCYFSCYLDVLSNLEHGTLGGRSRNVYVSKSIGTDAVNNT